MTNERKDEIDLIEVFLTIYVFFKKHFWFLVISVVIGGVFGHLAKFYTKKYYESDMLVKSYVIPDDIFIRYIQNIQNVLSDGNIDFLSSRMEIDSSMLSKLKGINAEIEYDQKDNKKSLEYIKITAKVSDNKIFPDLQKAINNFLSKELYVQSEIEVYKENNLYLIANIENEIEKVKELQKLNLMAKNKGEVNIYNNQNSFQREILNLLKEKQNRENLLRFAVPCRVIQDFTIYQKPKVKNYTYLVGFIFGFTALLFLIFKNINKTIKKDLFSN